MAGYSGMPLVKKIGIKENHRVLLIEAPAGFGKTLGKLPEGAKVLKAAEPPVHVVLGFAKSRSDVSARFTATVAQLDQAGMIWIGWPKKASGVATELNENIVREIGLAKGLVDIKVCAIDDIWSGLKFVIRKENRRGPGWLREPGVPVDGKK
jgi:hypothetical protein